MEKVVIVEAVRTPIGKIGGTLKSIKPEKLTETVLRGVIDKIKLDKSLINEVIIGQAKQSCDAPNIARVASLMADIPEDIPAYTVHRQCASGMQAIANAMMQIQIGYSDIVLAGGVESMSTAQFYIRGARYGLGNGNTFLIDPNTESQPKSQPKSKYGEFNMIQTADNVAHKYNISREYQDEFAYKSQIKAIEAIDNNKFKDEIVSVEVKDRKGNINVFENDEYPRRSTSLKKLAKLKPIFEPGTVTAGNASGRNDGASALVIMSLKKARQLHIEPLCEIIGVEASGADPRLMGIGPIYSTNKLLKKLNMKTEHFELVEINEAFAAQTIACINELKINKDRVNVNGGAISLGHPLGCSGARISTTLIHEMKKRNVKYGLATLCVAGGMGMSIAFKNIQDL